MIVIDERDDRFYVAESRLPGAGRGLFAAVEIKEGEVIEVKGVMVEKGSPADICTSYADAFKFASDYEGEYTHHIIPMGYAGLVNHADEPESQNVEIRHLEGEGGATCVYYFLKGVKKGEEILGNYGEGWRRLTDWSREVNESSDEDEEREWASFLGRGLYNLEKLKKPQEKNAQSK